MNKTMYQEKHFLASIHGAKLKKRSSQYRESIFTPEKDKQLESMANEMLKKMKEEKKEIHNG